MTTRRSLPLWIALASLASGQVALADDSGESAGESWDTTASVSGVVLNAATKAPVQGVEVEVSGWCEGMPSSDDGTVTFTTDEFGEWGPADNAACVFEADAAGFITVTIAGTSVDVEVGDEAGVWMQTWVRPDTGASAPTTPPPIPGMTPPPMSSAFRTGSSAGYIIEDNDWHFIIEDNDWRNGYIVEDNDWR